jgi:DNA-directed RNA polymerase III subunit RPC1
VITTLLSPNKQIRVIINIEVMEKNYNKVDNLRAADISDGYVFFQDSELISGNLGKATLGGSKDGLLYSLVTDNSRYLASLAMSRFSKLSARWFTNYGMTLGLVDVTPDASLTVFKSKLIEKKYGECDELIRLYNDNKIVLKPGCNAEQTLESEMTNILNEIREDAGNFCFKNLSWDNSALRMAVCGSKGSNMNLS